MPDPGSASHAFAAALFAATSIPDDNVKALEEMFCRIECQLINVRTFRTPASAALVQETTTTAGQKDPTTAANKEPYLPLPSHGASKERILQFRLPSPSHVAFDRIIETRQVYGKTGKLNFLRST